MKSYERIFNRDEEKRKMCHSTSIKNLQPSSIIAGQSDEDIHELMSTLLDKIDRDNNPSEETSKMLFNLSSSTSHQRLSSSSNDELVHPLDEWKHSGGILVEQKDVPTRKSNILICQMRFDCFAKSKMFSIGDNWKNSTVCLIASGDGGKAL